jgi:hypothetical protein
MIDGLVFQSLAHFQRQTIRLFGNGCDELRLGQSRDYSFML